MITCTLVGNMEEGTCYYDWNVSIVQVSTACLLTPYRRCRLLTERRCSQSCQSWDVQQSKVPTVYVRDCHHAIQSHRHRQLQVQMPSQSSTQALEWCGGTTVAPPGAETLASGLPCNLESFDRSRGRWPGSARHEVNLSSARPPGLES